MFIKHKWKLRSNSNRWLDGVYSGVKQKEVDLMQGQIFLFCLNPPKLTANWHPKNRSHWQRQLGQYIASNSGRQDDNRLMKAASSGPRDKCRLRSGRWIDSMFRASSKRRQMLVYRLGCTWKSWFQASLRRMSHVPASPASRLRTHCREFHVYLFEVLSIKRQFRTY